jgi:tetratricopeptide (TPR) repeat protein
MKQTLIIIALVLSCAGVFGKAIVTPNEWQDKTAMDYVMEGSLHYRNGDYKKAIPPYQKALELEKAHSTLEKKFWIVLVDNLGMAYGISGDLKKAKEVFEYGISKDGDYPLFYYNMACTYGEMKDMDKTIEYLKLAFARKKNMIEGEEFPDPATDSSFERFMKDQKFLDALKEMKNQ